MQITLTRRLKCIISESSTVPCVVEDTIWVLVTNIWKAIVFCVKPHQHISRAFIQRKSLSCHLFKCYKLPLLVSGLHSPDSFSCVTNGHQASRIIIHLMQALALPLIKILKNKHWLQIHFMRKKAVLAFTQKQKQADGHLGINDS